MAKVYNFNGLADGASDGTFIAGGDSPDVVNITYGEGFFTTNIRNEGTNVVIETEIGGTSATFLMQGVILDQLSNQNFSMNSEGVVRIGNNNPNTLEGNIVVGKGGGDDITGTADNDFLAGNAGDDHIHGGGGMDRIRGGQGVDTIDDFDAGSIVYGDKGGDFIYAGSFMNEEGDDTGVTIFGGSGDPNDPLDGGDTIEGSDYDDVIQGNGGDDVIKGKQGDDEIRGGKDDDNIKGGNGDDWIRGDKGDDILLSGDKGDDIIEGGDGEDEIVGGQGADLMSGGADDDTFGFYLPTGGSDQSIIHNLTVENISKDELNVPAGAFGESQLDNLDWITDLDLGGKNGSNDLLGFEEWDPGPNVFVKTVDNVSASNVQQLLDVYEANMDAGDYIQNAILINVNGGDFANKSFLVIDAIAYDGGPDDAPEYLLQVTGYTGKLDAGDLINYDP